MLLLIPIIYLLAFFGVLPSYTLIPVVFGGFVFIIVMIAFVVAQIGIFSSFMSRSKHLKKYSDPDPSVYSRAVKDGADGPDYLIRGSETTTFREACLDNWQFKSVDRKSNWMVRDDRGNDVTDQSLSRFDGILIMEGEYWTEEPSNESDEYTSIHDSVEYYD